MGKAIDWQEEVTNLFEGRSCIILNPRRGDWDSTWEPVSTNERFSQQVNWELDHLEACDLILMYLQPGTHSPISLMELGLFASTGKMVVCCPEGFWRKGNVDIVAARHGVPVIPTYEEFLEHAAGWAEKFNPLWEPNGRLVAA